MSTKKKVSTIIIVFLIGLSPVFGYNWVHPEYENFGIKSVGIYIDHYGTIGNIGALKPTTRTYGDNLYNLTDRNTGQQKRYYLNLDEHAKITPPLTTPRYPLNQEKAPAYEGTTHLRDESKQALADALMQYLKKTEYEPQVIEPFSSGDTLKTLLSSAAEEGLDAVLLVRYYCFKGYRPIDKDPDKLYSNMRGFGISPAIELYDTKTGVRLWYSAYHSYHIDDTSGYYFDAYEEFLRTIFVEGEEPYKAAAERIVDYTLDSRPSTFYNKIPLPIALDPPTRDDSIARKAARRQFVKPGWEVYAKTTSFISFTYGLEYFDNPIIDVQDVSETWSVQTENALGHKISLVPIRYGRNNFVVQPLHINIHTLSYNDNGIQFSGWGSLGGMLEYHLRIHDYHTLFFGLELSYNYFYPITGYPTGEEEISLDDSEGFLQPQLYAGAVFNKAKRGRLFPKKVFLAFTPPRAGENPRFSLGFGLQLLPTYPGGIITGYRIIDPHSRDIY